MEVLRHVADAVGALPRGFAKDTYSTSLGLQEAEHQFEERSLTATVGTQKGDEISPANSEIYVLKNWNSIVEKPDIFNLYNWLIHETPHLRAVLSLAATWRKFSAQSGASGSTTTICAVVACAIVRAACQEN